MSVQDDDNWRDEWLGSNSEESISKKYLLLENKQEKPKVITPKILEDISPHEDPRVEKTFESTKYYNNNWFSGKF